ncbi:MAG TPA: protein kinase [Acidobacteriota bacterium]|nr:protein kinase [Acidobacteriota bacterium]
MVRKKTLASMNPERWKQIDKVLNVVLDLDAEKRAAYLNEVCAGDEELRKEVESLLAADEKAVSFIKKPAAQLSSELPERPVRLSPGKSVGPYKILSLLAAGGMGEVYRASDPRIQREVALKILPTHFSEDPDRVRRFEQEARAAGLLNHTNIVAIYDAGTEKGVPYLVSELLQGEVLHQKLNGQPLPVRKAIDYSIQIAKGLSAAHAKGIVHRDLKPHNIFVTKEGVVKILDFGLAKLTHPEESPKSFNEAERLTHHTESGVIVGTIVYMSPEQVRGLKIDHRSDIFAFGAILFEMLSGLRPFNGEHQIEVMHAILKSDPPELSQINVNVPLALERIVRRSLEKDPDHRFQSTNDLAFALESLSSTSAANALELDEKKPIQLSWILSAIFFLVAMIFGVLFFRSLSKTPSPETPSSVQRLSIVLPENTILNSSAISPDGQHLAYIINGTTGFSNLWLRSMDSTQAQEIPGTEDATLPFWSPDSRSIAFFTETELKKWTIGGGPPEILCNVDIAKGGTWNQYGDILFATRGSEGLYRISARGGEITPATTIDVSREGRHAFPQFLPDGRHFFYMIRGGKGVYIGSLDSKIKKLIFPESIPVRYIDPGYLLFPRNNKLMVQHFDKNRLELTGEATPITDNWSGHVSGPDFSVSENLLVYGSSGGGWATQPIWFDRSGKQSSPLKNYPSAIGEPGDYGFCDLSSDDKQLLTVWRGAMWIVDLFTGSFIRYAMTNEKEAVFSPNASEVAYKDVNLYKRSSSGTGKAELLADSVGEDLSWSDDGRFITFSGANPKTNFDLWVLPLDGQRKPFSYLQTEAREESAVLSPDGKWVAYQSYQSGTSEIYVRSFPVEAGGVWAISTDGGEKPIWRPDGKEIFYFTLDKKLMAVEVQTGEVFKPGATRFLFQTHAQPRINTWGIGKGKQYFVSSDGSHFLVNTLIDSTDQAEINVLVNWKSLLKKKN